jgi:Fe-S cluster assembly iron-binding protein IscA
MIRVTEKAVSELKSLLEENQGKSLRVLFQGYG